MGKIMNLIDNLFKETYMVQKGRASGEVIGVIDIQAPFKLKYTDSNAFIAEVNKRLRGINFLWYKSEIKVYNLTTDPATCKAIDDIICSSVRKTQNPKSLSAYEEYTNLSKQMNDLGFERVALNCNVKKPHSYMIWINKSTGKVFEINESHDLGELKSFLTEIKDKTAQRAAAVKSSLDAIKHDAFGDRQASNGTSSILTRIKESQAKLPGKQARADAGCLSNRGER